MHHIHSHYMKNPCMSEDKTPYKQGTSHTWHEHTHIHMYARTYTHTGVHEHKHAHTHTHMHVHTHANMYPHARTHVHKCMHIQTHAQIHTQTHTHTPSSLSFCIDTLTDLTPEAAVSWTDSWEVSVSRPDVRIISAANSSSSLILDRRLGPWYSPLMNLSPPSCRESKKATWPNLASVNVLCKKKTTLNKCLNWSFVYTYFSL